MFSRLAPILLFAALTILPTAPASAAVTIITQAKAEAGTVTPEDEPGFPVTLSRPGAYRFDTNLNVPNNKVGLRVTSEYVDIDMNGFRLWGWKNNTGTRWGTVGLVSSFGLGRIRNGFIAGFKTDGIRLVSATSGSWVVEDMQIFGNGGHGIGAEDSDYHRFSRNSILRNVSAGIRCGRFCLIEANVIADNSFDGIYLQSGTILGNSIFSNGYHGIFDDGVSTDTGYGNNTLANNDDDGNQVNGGHPLQPNACNPTPC